MRLSWEYRVVEFGGNAPPLGFLRFQRQRGKSHTLRFPLPGFTHGKIDITEKNHKQADKKHQKPQQTKI
jgi:hypothetical protein